MSDPPDGAFLALLIAAFVIANLIHAWMNRHRVTPRDRWLSLIVVAAVAPLIPTVPTFLTLFMIGVILVLIARELIAQP